MMYFLQMAPSIPNYSLATYFNTMMQFLEVFNQLILVSALDLLPHYLSCTQQPLTRTNLVLKSSLYNSSKMEKEK